jgi:hypothetical protein
MGGPSRASSVSPCACATDRRPEPVADRCSGLENPTAEFVVGHCREPWCIDVHADGRTRSQVDDFMDMGPVEGGRR